MNVEITVFDHAGKGAFAWQLARALPTKFKAAELNARATEVAVEELHLVHEGIVRAAPAESALTAGV